MPENIYCDEPSIDSITPGNGVYFSKCDVPGRLQSIKSDDYVEPSKEGVYDYDLPSDDTYDALEYSSKDTMDSLPSVETNVHQSKDAVSSRTALYIIVVTFLSTAGIGISIYGFVYLGQVNGKCEKILIHGDGKLNNKASTHNLSEIIFLFFKTVERLLHYLRLVQIQTKDVFSPSHTREKNLRDALLRITMDLIGVLRK